MPPSPPSPKDTATVAVGCVECQNGVFGTESVLSALAADTGNLIGKDTVTATGRHNNGQDGSGAIVLSREIHLTGRRIRPTAYELAGRTVREASLRPVRGRDRAALASVTGHADPKRAGGDRAASRSINTGFRLLGPQVNRYNAPMTPRSALWMYVPAVLLVGGFIAGSVSGPVAAAESGPPMNPPPDDPAESSCSFTLSAPQLISLPGGAGAVTATMTVSACSGTAQATSSTICVSTPDGPGNCATAPAWNPAQVFVTASKLTGRFTARANGCWEVLGLTGANYTCAPLGPVITTI